MSWDDIDEKIRHLAGLAESKALPNTVEVDARRHLEELKRQHATAMAASDRMQSYPAPSNLDKLSMRMGWDEGRVKAFQHLDIVSLPDKVMVWVITKDDFQSVVIEDDVSMFPSDTLITQLRLLEKV